MGSLQVLIEGMAYWSSNLMRSPYPLLGRFGFQPQDALLLPVGPVRGLRRALSQGGQRSPVLLRFHCHARPAQREWPLVLPRLAHLRHLPLGAKRHLGSAR